MNGLYTAFYFPRCFAREIIQEINLFITSLVRLYGSILNQPFLL